jgi:hypothetical protein
MWSNSRFLPQTTSTLEQTSCKAFSPVSSGRTAKLSYESNGGFEDSLRASFHRWRDEAGERRRRVNSMQASVRFFRTSRPVNDSVDRECWVSLMGLGGWDSTAGTSWRAALCRTPRSCTLQLARHTTTGFKENWMKPNFLKGGPAVFQYCERVPPVVSYPYSLPNSTYRRHCRGGSAGRARFLSLCVLDTLPSWSCASSVSPGHGTSLFRFSTIFALLSRSIHYTA